MKKRTKKKINKAIKKGIKAVFKGIWTAIKWIFIGIWTAIVWSAGEIYHLGKKGTEHTAQKIKETKHKRAIEKEQPKNEAEEQHFEDIKTLKGTTSQFEDWLYSKSSLIGIILGARGTGKSAIGMFLLENFKVRSSKKIYALGFKQTAVPKWIKVIKSIEEIENDAVLLIDEGGIEFSSRSSMSDANKLLSEILLVARHKDLTVLFITQNCLPISTKIQTPNGIKTLKDLQDEDIVYSFDFDNQKIAISTARKHSVGKKKIVKIHLEDGTILKCSENHRWPVYNENGLSYVTAKNIKINKDSLFNMSNK